eukprot:tig00021350_g20622.t1
MISYEQSTWRATILLFFYWRGSVYRSIWVNVICWSIWGFVVGFYTTTTNRTDIENGWGIPDTMHAMAAFALGFLLVFRAQVAYARFWDIRTTFANICCGCRDVCAQLITFIDSSGKDPTGKIRSNTSRLIGGFITMTTQHLQTNGSIKDFGFLSHWMTEEEIEAIEKIPPGPPPPPHQPRPAFVH